MRSVMPRVQRLQAKEIANFQYLLAQLVLLEVSFLSLRKSLARYINFHQCFVNEDAVLITLFAADVCKNGALCPDSKFCPIVPAGGVCSPPVDAVTGANAAPARVAGDAEPQQVELYMNHTYI